MAIQDKQAYTDGAVIFREGQPADKVYLIAQGTVALYKNTPKGPEKLYSCETGEFVGINTLVAGSKYSVTGKAEGIVSAVPILSNAIEGQLERLDKLTLNMIKSVVSRHNKLLETQKP